MTQMQILREMTVQHLIRVDRDIRALSRTVGKLEAMGESEAANKLIERMHSRDADRQRLYREMVRRAG